jgi:fibronectin-binding autotransporter adhesin
MKNSIKAFLAVVVCALPASSSLFAATTDTWNGGSGAWNSANWTTVIPGAVGTTNNGDTAIFNSSLGTVTIDSGRSVKNITFDAAAGAYTLSAGPLLLTSGGTITLGTTATSFTGTNTTETVSAPIVLEGGYTFTNASTTSSDTLSFTGGITSGNGNNTLTLNGANTGANTISGVIGNGAGTVALTVGGTSNWILSAANTFAGATSTGSTSTLQIQNNNALQNSVVSIGQTNGLIFSAGTDLVNMAGLGSSSSNEALTDAGNSAVTLQLGLFNNVSAGTYSGILSGAGGITKWGAGTQTLAGNNTYTGTTTITGVTGDTLASTLGTSGTPFGTGSIVINGGTLSITSGTGAVADTGVSNLPGSTFSYGGGDTLFLKTGGTSLSYTIGNASPSGNVLVRTGNGVLVVQTNSADLGTNENFVVKGSPPAKNATNGMVSATLVTLGGGTAGQGDFLTYGGSFTGFGSDAANYTARSGTVAGGTTGANEISNVNATATFSGTNSTYALLVQNGVTLTLGPAAVLNVGDGGTGNPVGVIMNGSTITSTNTSGVGYTGVLNFGSEEGIIYDFKGGDAIQAAVTGTGGVTISGSGNQSFHFGSGSTVSGSTFTGGLNLEGGVTYVVQGNNGGSIGEAAENTQFGAPTNVINLNGATFSEAGLLLIPTRNMVLGADGGTIIGSGGNYNLNISGSGALTYAFGGNNSGYLTDTGVNTYTGGTFINSGLLGVAVASELGSSPITILGGSPAGLSIIGTSLHSLSNTITFDANTGGPQGFDIQNVNNTFTLSSTQVIDSGSSSFSKYGAGTLVLDGAETYSGTTELFGGTLKIDASAGGSLSPLTNIQLDGGYLYLLGSGTTTVQTLGNVTSGNKINSSGLNAGGGFIVNSNGGTATLNLGTLPGIGANGAISAITPGTVVSLQTIGSNASITTTSQQDGSGGNSGLTNGIYGGRIVYTNSSGVTDWAASATNVGGSPNTISNYNDYIAYTHAYDGTSGDDNVKITGSLLGGSSTTVNTVKIANGATAGTYDLKGETLTLNSGGLLFTGTSAYTIADTVGGGTIRSGVEATGGSLNNGQNTSPDASELIIQDFGTGTLTISAVLSNPAILSGSISSGTAAQNYASGAGQAAILTKAGPGTLVLSGNNTYSGTTYVDGGVLSISADNNLGGGNGTVSNVTSTGGSNIVTIAGPLPAGFGVGTKFLGQQVNTITYNGSVYTITLGGNITAASAQVLTNGTSSYATAGSIVLNGGTLQFTNTMTLQESNTGGTAGTNTQARNIQLGSSGGTVNVLNGSTVTYNSTLSSTDSGYSSFVMDSNDGMNGTFILNSNSGASLYGGITINGGILQPNYAGSLTTNNNGNATLSFGSGSEINPSTNAAVNTTPTLALSINQSFSALDSPSSTTAVVKGIGSTEYLIISNGGSDSYSGLLANGAATNVLGFTKGGSGIQFLTNTNSDYTGITTIDAGTLNVASLSNGGTAALTPTIATVLGSTSATLTTLTGLVSGTTYTIASANVPAGTTFTYNGTANVTLSTAATATATGTGTVVGFGSSIGMATNAAGNIVFGGAFKGSAVLQYTGTTGAISTDHLFTIGDASNSSGRSGISGSISGNTATLDSSSTTAGATTSFTNTGAIAFANAAYTHNLTLTGSNSGTATSMNTFAPLLGDMAGGLATSLNKTGTGSWAVTNNNTYSGGTTVSGGTFYVNNAGGVTSSPTRPPVVTQTITAANSGSGTGSGTVTVQSGGTLAGTGTITPGAGTGGVVVQSGGTLAPGGVQSNAAPYTASPGLTLNNSVGLSSILTVNAGAQLTFALGSGVGAGSGANNYANPNTNSSYLNVAGDTAGEINFTNSSLGSGAVTINLVDLTTTAPIGTTLTLRQQNPYLLVQAGSNSDYNLITSLNGVLSVNGNGYVVGVGSSTSSYNSSAFNIQVTALGSAIPINSPTNYQNLQLYLYNGDLEVVPEPGTWALMLGGLAFLVFVQRRRLSRNR